jgi:hypothetical protein
MKMHTRIAILALLFYLICGITNSYAKLNGPALRDSLFKELSRSKEDSNKVNILGDLSDYYYDFNPDSGFYYAKSALDVSTKLGWKKGIAGSYSMMGFNACMMSDFKNAIDYLDKAISIYKELKK